MPPLPEVNFFVRYFLENPWPVGSLAAAVAVIFGIIALREGRTAFLRIAAGAAMVCVLVFLVAYFVTTSGERGRQVVAGLVEHAVNGRVTEALAQFSQDATIAFGSPASPSFDFSLIRSGLNAVDGRYQVESHRITGLHGYTISRDEAEVRLGVWATVNSIPTRTSWIFEVKRTGQGRDEWKITRVVWVDFNDQVPQPQWLR